MIFSTTPINLKHFLLSALAILSTAIYSSGAAPAVRYQAGDTAAAAQIGILTIRGQKKMAMLITPYIASITGWGFPTKAVE